jgi:hypothetical protein
MNVQPITGEVGRYRVESRSKREAPEHTIDILEDECSCRTWVCRHRSYREEQGRPYRCAHILAAREYALNDFIEVMRDHALAR